jgi:hypothetical protein
MACSAKPFWKSAKSENHLFAGKPEVCKKGLAKPAPFLEQEQRNTDRFFLFFFQKRRNRVLPFLQISGFPDKSRFLLLSEEMK